MTTKPESETEETPVLFRVPKRKEKGVTDEITAVFPCDPADYPGHQMSCYAHVGQHSACGLDWYNETRAAKPEEYADLKGELESAIYGYRLKIYTRLQPWMHTARRAAVAHQNKLAAERAELENKADEVLRGLLGYRHDTEPLADDIAALVEAFRSVRKD